MRGYAHQCREDKQSNSQKEIQVNHSPNKITKSPLYGEIPSRERRMIADGGDGIIDVTRVVKLPFPLVCLLYISTIKGKNM